MSYALVLHYGRWTLGGAGRTTRVTSTADRWGTGAAPRDSITTPEETLARVEAALREWREWLEHLAAWFEIYPLNLSAVEDQRIFRERAARNLILQVVDRTGCGSGWHNHCRQVLTWFLDRWEVSVEVAQGLVGEAVGGRFHSWAGPDTVVVDDVAEQLALCGRATAVLERQSRLRTTCTAGSRSARRCRGTRSRMPARTDRWPPFAMAPRRTSGPSTAPSTLLGPKGLLRTLEMLRKMILLQ